MTKKKTDSKSKTNQKKSTKSKPKSCGKSCKKNCNNSPPPLNNTQTIIKQSKTNYLYNLIKKAFGYE